MLSVPGMEPDPAVAASKRFNRHRQDSGMDFFAVIGQLTTFI